MAEGYNYGIAGISKEDIPTNGLYSRLSENLRNQSYMLGENAANARDEVRESKLRKGRNGKTGRKRGVVKGEGVSISDLKKTFNDTQNKAYKILSTYADATGIDIVLYKSEADADGNFKGEQGKFSRKNNTIYIDINAGLFNEMDVSDLGKYAMLRTFAHEFSHFLEKNAPKDYTAFKKIVFNTLSKRGENVNDLIEEKMSYDDSLSYDDASREVLAEAMTDILPDSKFISELAENNNSIFQKLIDKLKEFLDDLKDYFKNIGSNRSREANALKEEINGEIHYLENIVKEFDKVALKAIENYQSNNAVDEEYKYDPENTYAKEAKEYVEDKGLGFAINDLSLKKHIVQVDIKAPYTGLFESIRINNDNDWNEVKTAADKLFERDKNISERDAKEAQKKESKTTIKEIDTMSLLESVNKAQATANETGEEQSVKLSDHEVKAEPRVTTSENGYTIMDNTELNSIEIKFDEKPSEAIRNVLKANKFRWNGKKGIWYGRTSHEAISEALDLVYGTDESKTNNDLKEEKPNETDAGQTESNETLRENNNGAVLQSESNGEGVTRLLDERETEDVQRASGSGETVVPTSERGEQTKRDSMREPSDTGDSRSEGTGESRDLRLEEEPKTKEEELHKIVSKEIEQKSTETPKGNNFVIGDSLELPKGEKARVRANIDAIKLIKQLETEGRNATVAEQEILSKYVGWGGLSNTFGEMRYNSAERMSEMVAKKGWESEFAELNQLVADGIIAEQEYKDMSASTKNAHYTSVEVIKAMYDGLAQLGFDGGRMLEPSSGVGNFVGCMPANLTSKVNSWTMVELDRITGQIAKYLYPNADVRIQGFEQANIPNNYMDVAIGNVPFGNYGVVDRAYPKRITKAIHNYFFAKTLDKVRPGGLVMFITSSFTMNGKDTAVRHYIMDRADLIGAIRLPNTAFSENAGTEVVTDIIVLKKRMDGTEYAGESFLNSEYTQLQDWHGDYVNEYFANHPEMVLGTPEFTRGMYGSNTLTYKPLEGKGSLGEQIKEAFKNIDAKMDYTVKASPEQVNKSVAKANSKTKNNGLVVNSDGTISKNQNGELVKYDVDTTKAKKIAGLLSIRDAYRNLADTLQQGQDEATINKARKELNTIYDKFVKENGFINAPKNKSVIADDAQDNKRW